MAGAINSFTQLRTWQSARHFAFDIYKIADKFPSSEKFGMSSQIKRSSVSVAANIAEGFSRDSKKEKIRFYSIARGSLTETQSHLYIAYDLGFISQKDLEYRSDDIVVIQKMLVGLMKSAEERIA